MSLVPYHPPVCTFCRIGHGPIMLDEDKLERWASGELIQNVFPELSADIREVIMTGTHQKCWDDLFKEPEEDVSN